MLLVEQPSALRDAGPRVRRRAVREVRVELSELSAVVPSFQRVGHASHVERALPSRRGVTLQGRVVEYKVAYHILSR